MLTVAAGSCLRLAMQIPRASYFFFFLIPSTHSSRACHLATDLPSMTSIPGLALVPSYAHKTNPTLHGLSEELVVSILELSVTFDKPLQEVLRITKRTESGETLVLACAESPPLPLSILFVNKAIYRFAIKAFYRLNRFSVRFENIRIGPSGTYLGYCLSRCITARPAGLPSSLDMNSIRTLGLAYRTMQAFGPSGRNPGNINYDEVNSKLKPSIETLLTYLAHLPHLNSLVVSFSSATEFLVLWKYFQAYKATATGIGEITIPGADGRHHILRFPDLAAAWEQLTTKSATEKAIGRTARRLNNMVLTMTNRGFVPCILLSFYELANGVAKLRLQRLPGEPKRFLAFNLALMTQIMIEESAKCLSRTSRGVSSTVHWEWSESDASDSIHASDETPEVFNAMYNRSMKESLGWYGDADWSRNPFVYNQLCTPTAANGFQFLQVVPDDGQHTGERWLRSFWKSYEEYECYTRYNLDWLYRGGDILRFGGILR